MAVRPLREGVTLTISAGDVEPGQQLPTLARVVTLEDLFGYGEASGTRASCHSMAPTSA